MDYVENAYTILARKHLDVLPDIIKTVESR